MKNLYCKFCFFICFSAVGQTSPQIAATLKVVDDEGMITIEGYAKNNSAVYQGELMYLLVGLKTGATGNLSKNQQSGKFSLAPDESRSLTTLKVNRQPQEEIKLFLFIRKKDKLIDKDTLVIGDKKKTGKVHNTDAGIEIKGLVVEEVITKLGKDFYDFFYQKYSSSSQKYPFVVKITEKPLPGISSQVTVYADDEAIFRSNTSPNEEYLENSAQQAILALNKYFQQRQLLYKKNVKY